MLFCITYFLQINYIFFFIQLQHWELDVLNISKMQKINKNEW